MIVQLTLEEGGNWWHVEVFNTDNIKQILNTGYWNNQKVYALMFFYEQQEMIYDFVIRKWR